MERKPGKKKSVRETIREQDNKNVKVIITAHIARTNNCDANYDGKGNPLTIERGEKVRDTYLSLLPEDLKNSVEFEIIDGGFVVDNYECSNGIVSDKTKQAQNRKVDVRVVKK